MKNELYGRWREGGISSSVYDYSKGDNRFMTDGLRELEGIDREKLVLNMQKNLTDIIENANMDLKQVSRISGISADKIRMASKAKEDRIAFKWNEYLSLLFVFWKSKKARMEVEERGLFPRELKNALSVNRNAHLNK